MPEYSRPLGDALKRASGKLDLTQHEVASAANIDVRTVLNIENYKGSVLSGQTVGRNPVLYGFQRDVQGRGFQLLAHFVKIERNIYTRLWSVPPGTYAVEKAVDRFLSGGPGPV